MEEGLREMERVKNLLLYGGLSREKYLLIKQQVIEEASASLNTYAPIATVVFLVLYVMSLMSGGIPEANHFLYQVSCIIMGLITTYAHFIMPRHQRLVVPLMHAFAFGLYTFSILVSMNHLEYPAVSAIVVLTIVPLLMFDSPIRVGLGTIAATVAICVMSITLKSAELANLDVWNALTFGGVALVCNVAVMRAKYHSTYRKYKVEYLSETDTLTKIKNRNCFEERVENYPRVAEETVVCVYADADGLHEINNTVGHAAGDAFLQTIARELSDSFGAENSYRIGGDEFVVLLADEREEDVRAKMKPMHKRLVEQGYWVSYGVSEAQVPVSDMHDLIREAEVEMYNYKLERGDARNDIQAQG
jgi:diguanylate cyclase (GGDEF)-like protein